AFWVCRSLNLFMTALHASSIKGLSHFNSLNISRQKEMLSSHNNSSCALIHAPPLTLAISLRNKPRGTEVLFSLKSCENHSSAFLQAASSSSRCSCSLRSVNFLSRNTFPASAIRVALASNVSALILTAPASGAITETYPSGPPLQHSPITSV